MVRACRQIGLGILHLRDRRTTCGCHELLCNIDSTLAHSYVPHFLAHVRGNSSSVLVSGGWRLGCVWLQQRATSGCNCGQIISSLYFIFLFFFFSRARVLCTDAIPRCWASASSGMARIET